MKAMLIAQIRAENNKVQAIQATQEPVSLEAGYERLQKLIWDLKQSGYNYTIVRRVWPRMVNIGNSELRIMRARYQKTLGVKAGLQETADYINVHSQLKEQINQTILLLF
ncbi:hypothetical protein GO755_20625 [Spirosoma sp. HMF4905]|uniref:Uncharacterized protein n=1 Tax=Spirosoma arboris TaxID=2682092 RepID=A0A7K1SF77_9BACT|nr:hypothetical protein [Spirosoma arboris]MVM32462.1 hypothetical protein [Spirosoma arboris]